MKYLKRFESMEDSKNIDSTSVTEILEVFQDVADEYDIQLDVDHRDQARNTYRSNMIYWVYERESRNQPASGSVNQPPFLKIQIHFAFSDLDDTVTTHQLISDQFYKERKRPLPPKGFEIQDHMRNVFIPRMESVGYTVHDMGIVPRYIHAITLEYRIYTSHHEMPTKLGPYYFIYD